MTTGLDTLTPEQWQQISPYLDEALELAAGEREIWIRSLRERNPDLAETLQNLLDQQTVLKREGFLEVSPFLPITDLTGQTVGAYTLVSQIGQGGMGSVWLAHRSDGRFERQAAVKFVNLAFANRGSAFRFKRESSILGRLLHPHIAELFDAGVSTNGQPYLVLEYVDGVVIDQYCDTYALDIDLRIRLFLDVLTAVAHAHANLIVHRDIKPSNVLVTRDGKVKLLDFGIAKLLQNEGQAVAATLLTQESGSALTLQYAAPEQIKNLPITTATDIYALGLVLYVLLSGQHPLGAAFHSPVALIKAVLDTEPPPLSEIVGATNDKTLAARRGTTPDKLRRQLQGDLDTIVGKTLKKNPDERYQSVTAFADDLQRYLRNEAINARPDTFAYRTAKFVRRNRTVVALTTVAVLLVIGSLSTGLYIATRERRIAEQRFAQVRQLANKFIALDNEIRGLQGSTKVRMEMVSDSLQYLTSLGSDVHGDKDLALEIAYAYVRVAHAQGDPTSPNLGQFAEAGKSLERAENFVDGVLSKYPDNPRALFIATTIAHDRMVLADSRSDHAEALRYAASAVSLIERFMSTRPVELHDLYSMRYFYTNIGYAYCFARHFDEAMRYLQRALDIPLPVPNANDLRGDILAILGSARWQAGDLDDAANTTLAAIKLEEEEAEAKNGHAALRINLANGLYQEGMILGRQDAEPSLGRTRDALVNFEKALDIAEDLSKKDPLDYLSRHNVAIFGLEVGNTLRHSDPGKALLVYDHALARIREAKSNPSAQRDESELLSGSSYPLRWLGQTKEAKQRIARALELLSQADRYPVDKIEPMSDAYDVLRAQADDYAETGQIAKAVEAYKQLLDKLTSWQPDLLNDLRDATCISRTWTALADLLRRNGQKNEASQLELHRAELWKHWQEKILNAHFLLVQSLNQITPHRLSTRPTTKNTVSSTHPHQFRK
jgi:serine/threonine protein kinase/tetratricopeptide (TPR) repeat protein